MRRAVPIVGDRPESGVRIAIERPHGEGPPWRYEGFVHTPEASANVVVVVSESGEVTVDGPEAEKVRLIVRTAFKQAKSDGEAPARRIVRWRGEK